MKNNDLFLNLYKEYEMLLRERNLMCKEYEDSLDDSFVVSRLSMCRQLRNYMSHVCDPGFISVSNTQIKFLQSVVNNIKLEKDVLKQHLMSAQVGIASQKNPCFEILKRMSKRKLELIVVKTKTGFGVASVYSVAGKVIEQRKAKMDSIRLSRDLDFAEPLTDIKDLPKCPIVCTKDGTCTTDVLGVFYNN